MKRGVSDANPTPKMKNQTRERVEAMRQEIRTERDVKKTIDKGVLPSAVVGVNFTTRGNLTLHIKNLNKTPEKLKPFGSPIENHLGCPEYSENSFKRTR